MRNLMARIQPKHWFLKLLGAILSGSLVAVSILVFAEPSLTQEGSTTGEAESHRAMRILSLVREKGRVGYTHVWPMNSQSTGTEEEATRSLESNDDRNEEVVGEPPPCGPTGVAQTETKEYKKEQVSIIENVYWKELALLVTVWVIILALQIGKNYSTACSMAYWLLNILQIPVAFGVSSYEAVCLYKGRRKIASKGDAVTIWKVSQLVLYCIIGLLAGIVGGMLGLGGGFILGPLFLEMGIPPQVSSATATFAMMFSASMSVVEYYLLKRFPVPYALYYFAVATVAALVGQHVVRKLISILGRASLIIFTLAFTIFLSALLLGGVGIARMVKRIERKEYMGFENICS
ncbi:CEREBLON [Salix viminalis]|uniref:CEREBLON n=1 Tax=Salix viminalis TaxID=40686 RepID=A0A9Q0TP40_SALVM|nr:CEREBLON [Salix viminalis]